MGMLCAIFKHKYKLVMNAHHHESNNEENRIGIWQCERCKVVAVDSPSEYVDRKRREGKYHAIINGDEI